MVLFIEPNLIAGFLIYFVAVFALAIGTVLIVKAILGIIYKYKAGWIVLYFVMAALAIAFGILSLCYRGEFTQVIYVATGAFVLALGIFLLIFGIKALSNKNNNVIDQ